MYTVLVPSLNKIGPCMSEKWLGTHWSNKMAVSRPSWRQMWVGSSSCPTDQRRFLTILWNCIHWNSLTYEQEILCASFDNWYKISQTSSVVFIPLSHIQLTTYGCQIVRCVGYCVQLPWKRRQSGCGMTGSIVEALPCTISNSVMMSAVTFRPDMLASP